MPYKLSELIQIAEIYLNEGVPDTPEGRLAYLEFREALKKAKLELLEDGK